ncbi:MAG: hypothetical protein WCH00_02440 [Candidatus Saccharibacteria bacterium]
MKKTGLILVLLVVIILMLLTGAYYLRHRNLTVDGVPGSVQGANPQNIPQTNFQAATSQQQGLRNTLLFPRTKSTLNGSRPRCPPAKFKQ